MNLIISFYPSSYFTSQPLNYSFPLSWYSFLVWLLALPPHNHLSSEFSPCSISGSFLVLLLYDLCMFECPRAQLLDFSPLPKFTFLVISMFLYLHLQIYVSCPVPSPKRQTWTFNCDLAPLLECLADITNKSKSKTELLISFSYIPHLLHA